MMNRFRLLVAAAVCLPLLAGCGRVVFKPNGPQPIALSPEQQQQLAQQQQQYQTRANQLDGDNQELEALLAQSRQQVMLLTDQVTATQDQLRTTADQLASAQDRNGQLQRRAEELMAKAQQTVAGGINHFAGASIQANNTLLKPLKISSMPGVDVRQDGDVIRVAVASDQLFMQGSGQLNMGAEQMLRAVAADLMTNYPDHIIGIEGHTDGAPIASPQYPSSHHLSVAQATAVYETVRRTTGAPAQQLFVIGHGANHPLVSNGTEQGRAKNRRVELVVYPETVRRR